MDRIVLESLKGKLFKLEYDITYKLSDGTTIVIPKGFITDLSSVPDRLWGVFPPYGDFLMAAIVHDYLYVGDKSRGRKFADKEMLKISKKLNNKNILNKIDNNLRYAGVRVFGWYYWKYKDL